MSRVLYQLASRNVKKYKKYYIFIVVVVFIGTIIYMSTVLGYSNYFEVKKHYLQEEYGTWYVKVGVPDNSLDDALNKVKQKNLSYAIYYEQGLDSQGHEIGCLSQEFNQLCGLELVEGRYPQSQNEIMISDQLLNKFQIGQMVSLSINNKEEDDYKIVGVIHSSQEEYFPDIYTSLEEGSYYYIFLETNLWRASSHIDSNVRYVTEFNPYGFDANPNISSYQKAQKQVAVFIEILVLMMLSLSAVIASSLTKRTKEFALLRGIGMTNKQLFIMVLYENILTIFLPLLCGVILSFGVIYVAMLYFETIYYYFYFHIEMSSFLFYFIVLLICVMFATMIPIFLSTRRSLSGTFDAHKFSYIQIRYKKLTKQTSYQLAKREMSVQKKLTIFLVSLFTILSTYFVFTFMNPSEILKEKLIRSVPTFFYEYNMDDKKDLSRISSFPHTVVFYTKNLGNVIKYQGYDHLECDFIRTIQDMDLLKDFLVKGRMPQNPREILIDSFSELRSIEHIDNVHNISTVRELEVSDQFYIDNQMYTVVGELSSLHTLEHKNKILNEVNIIPVGIYLQQDDYLKLKGAEHYTVRTYFKNFNDFEKIRTQILDAGVVDNSVYFSHDCLIDFSDNYTEIINIVVDAQFFVLPISLCFIFCYFFNKNYLIHHFKDYMLYRFIGMTKGDLMRKEFFKAVRITLILFIVIMFWVNLLNIYTGVFILPIVEIFFMICFIFIVGLIVYCLPLYCLLKDNSTLTVFNDE